MNTSTLLALLVVIAGQAACILVYFQSRQRQRQENQLDKFLINRNPDFYEPRDRQ